MDRRKFIIGLGAALVVAPAAITLTGCGKSSSDETPAPANGFSVTSNPDNTAHTHNVIVLFADLTAPPSTGVTYTSDGGHTHTITLSQQQLTAINNGQTVGPVQSSVSNNHSHTWTITKPA